jgi:hypothetical protein
MADTSAQRQVAEWIRDTWLPRAFGARFEHRPVALSSGGQYQFDAVSQDGGTVVTISTSTARTESGKLGIGKVTKIRSDLYFLLLAHTNRRLALFTDGDMHQQWLKEREKGRVPNSIEFHLVELPPDLQALLVESRAIASREVTPGQG